MSTVWMRHPGLPEDQFIEVAREAVPHHARAGWVTVERAEAERAAAKAEAVFSLPPEGAPVEADVAEKKTESKARASRAASKKAEEN